MKRICGYMRNTDFPDIGHRNPAQGDIKELSNGNLLVYDKDKWLIIHKEDIIQ